MRRSPIPTLPLCFLSTLLVAASACKSNESPPPADAVAPAPPEATAATAGAAAPDAARSATAGDPGADAAEPEAPAEAKPAPKGVQSGPASDAIVAAARAIQKDLECLRGRPFKNDPKVAFQSLEDFRAYIDKQMKKEFASEKGERMTRVLHALKIVDPAVDLLADLAQAAQDQAAAYYDPDTDTFYVVMELPEMMLNAVMAHELQHALQDQHTDMLDEYLAEGFGTIDQDLAARFVVEGEATFVGHAWLMHRMMSQAGKGVCHLPGRAGAAPETFWPLVRDVVSIPANQTREEILNPGALERAAMAGMSESLSESMEKLKTVPAFVFYTLLLPYNQGGLTMYDRFAAGGYDWKSVDAVFADLPRSTEEVLHPEKLAAGGEPFATIELGAAPPLPEGWKTDPPDRLGELAIRILLIEHGVGERDANERAAGWNGDAVRVHHHADQLAVEWTTAWDDASEAEQFRAVLPKVIAHQRGVDRAKLDSIADASVRTGRTDFQWTDAKGRVRHGSLQWTADRVTWLDGWPAPLPL